MSFLLTLFNTEVLLTLFITINPMGILAPYMYLTSSYTKEERIVILKQAVFFSLFVLIGTVFLGSAILQALGISTFALQIAGGMLFFKFGYETLNGENTKNLVLEDTPSFVPLGFPIIAGPGSITALIIFTTLSNTTTENLIPALLFSIAIILGLTYFLLRHADLLTKTLGQKATNAILKITGLLIMAVGIQLILGGLSNWMSVIT